MTAILLRAGKYARIGGIVVQALTLVISITEHFSNKDGAAKQQDHTDDPENSGE